MTSVVMANGASNVAWDPALSRLLTSLQNAQESKELPATEDQFTFLSDYLKSKELNALFCTHNKVKTSTTSKKFCPVLSTSMQVMMDVLEELAPRTHLSDDSKELFFLLQRGHIQGLLCAHDAVAQKDYYPHLPEIPQEVDEDEETIKIVQLVKSNEPLGATIKTCEVTGKIVIARIMHGGAADRSGLIHVGDEVIEVNNINVEGKTPKDVLTILKNSEGTITFKIVPADRKNGIWESKVRVRAHFDYNYESDPYIPCKEAGLDFRKGDVLHIVAQDDNHWWQARKEGDKTMRAGLIPSRALQERRILHERASTQKDEAENDDFDREQIATYEEVAKLYPRPGIYRPIVLIGAPGIGRNELKRRLIATNNKKYKTPMPYTSRGQRPGEVNGQEYFFVERSYMENEIEKGSFIEYGEYKGNLYGTSLDSVRMLVNGGFVTILNPHYQALKMLRNPQLKPYIIYIKPPTMEVLKETRNSAHARSTFDVHSSRGFTDDEYKEILHASARIEFLYEHLFDEIIINADLASAFEQLVAAVNRVETEPLWAPASWVQ